MQSDTLKRIFAEDNQGGFLLRPALKDLGGEDVQRVLDIHSFFDLMQLPYPATTEAALQRLAQETLVLRQGAKWSVSNMGALLFAKNLGDFGLQRKAPRVIVYGGVDKLDTVRDLVGARGYAVGFQGLLDFIYGQIPANEVIADSLRTDVRMFPDVAVRELVANALIHQDVEDTSSFFAIEIYKDRMEVTNPGRPLIPPDRFIDEYKSRNERLTDVMRRLRICEEKSSGIDRVVSSAELYQLPAPDFRATEHHTSAVLFAHRPFEAMDRKDRVRACYQHACLRYVGNQKMTNHSLRERFGLPKGRVDAISRVIADTMDGHLIKIDDPESRSKHYAKYVPIWA